MIFHLTPDIFIPNYSFLTPVTDHIATSLPPSLPPSTQWARNPRPQYNGVRSTILYRVSKLKLKSSYLQNQYSRTPLLPRILYSRTPDPILSYPGSYTLVPRILYSRTPDLILSYPGSYTIVLQTLTPRIPDLMLSYP